VTSLNDMAAGVAKRMDRLRAAELTVARLETELATYKNEAEEWRIAQAEIIAIAQAIQTGVLGQIEELVTHALQYVFDETYAFRVLLVEKRGKTEVQFVVVKDGMELDPLTGCGGGVADVVSFALRLAAIVMHPTRTRRRLLLLDEPFKFLNVARRPAAAALLETLADKLDFQLILVTHDDEFTLGKVVPIG
jgi:DNA repair exonuclease SbcCD ATPase subunit